MAEEPGQGNRRRHPRFHCALDTVVQAGTLRGTAVINNLSHCGLFLATRFSATPGSAVELQFIESPDKLCSATGSYVRETDSGLGIEFTDANVEFVSFVRDLADASDAKRTRLLARVIAPQVRILGAR